MRFRTAGDYPMDEVASALQKAIRRGEEFEAVFWAQELESRYRHYVWRRLITVAHEDISIASPETIIFVEVCRTHYYLYQKGGRWENLPLIDAVLALARAPKCRTATDLHFLVYEDPKLRLEVPDHALDMHTERGRAKGRGREHFVTEAARLANEVEWPYKARFQDLWLSGRNVARAWIKDLTTRLKRKGRNGKRERGNGQKRLL